jgi:hypothetical protein
MNKYWLGVVSKTHIQNGIKGGFIQLNHGKKSALKKMTKGDWIVIYSPKLDFGDKTALQCFTALGKIRDGEIYQFNMGNGFIPFRIDIEYLPVKEIPIQPLLDKLSFTKDRTNWGFAFRFGHFEITSEDFQIIAKNMNENFI